MRDKLFKQNYELLKKIAPDMLEGEIKDYYLIHEFNDHVNQCMVIERVEKNVLSVGTFFTMNGDRVCDPDMWILFDNKLGLARIHSFTLDTAAWSMLGAAIHYNCDCYFSDFDRPMIEAERSAEEKEYNDYLLLYLKELADRIKQNSNLWEKVMADY